MGGMLGGKGLRLRLRKNIKSIKSMGDKEKKASLAVGIFAEQIRLKMLTPNELTFADGIVRFYNDKGYLSDRQVELAWKTVLRLIKERDLPKDFELFP